MGITPLFIGLLILFSLLGVLVLGGVIVLAVETSRRGAHKILERRTEQLGEPLAPGASAVEGTPYAPNLLRQVRITQDLLERADAVGAPIGGLRQQMDDLTGHAPGRGAAEGIRPTPCRGGAGASGAAAPTCRRDLPNPRPHSLLPCAGGGEPLQRGIGRHRRTRSDRDRGAHLDSRPRPPDGDRAPPPVGHRSQRPRAGVSPLRPLTEQSWCIVEPRPGASKDVLGRARRCPDEPRTPTEGGGPRLSRPDDRRHGRG